MQICDIDYQVVDRIATMTLNRPAKSNAITAETPDNLAEAVNQAYENIGLNSTQTPATLFDGFARHSPEGVAFKSRAEEAGFKHAVAERDSGAPIPGSKDSI